MKRIHKNMNYPPTDLVILASGQARRMNGINKLLQKFDDEIPTDQDSPAPQITRWSGLINSHRDHSIYERLIPSIRYFQG